MSPPSSANVPRGALIKTVPEWDIRAMALLGYYKSYYDTVNSYWYTYTIYNDDVHGRNLSVYALSLNTDVSYTIEWDFIKGTFGNFQVQGRSVYQPGPAMPGQLYVNSTQFVSGHHTPNPDITNPLGAMWPVSSMGAGQFRQPLWVLEPGWGLRLGNDFNSSVFAITCWYMIGP